VVFEGHSGGELPVTDLHAAGDGYFSGYSEAARDGSLYRYRLDGGRYFYPDPASRFQPQGPHGPSQVVDPERFSWTDRDWPGVPLQGQVIYELHVGTFTAEGTWTAAAGELRELADTGITVIEVMPVAEFPGRFGWGYDGVDLFAPTRLYGSPDDFRRFVDCAHSLGLGVILDVVYNHLGPDGNYLKQFAEQYFTNRYKTDWGEALQFDGEAAGPVREFFVANAGYWIEEYHLDGLRLDATQNMNDASPNHILAAIAGRVREAARGRATFVVAENEPQEVRIVQPYSEGGYGLDAIWNDDFHHSARVALSGHREAYYSDYRGRPQEFISAVKWGFLYQGQRYSWQKKRRGTPAFGLAPARFVNFLENHDQVANSARGLRSRLLSSPGRYRALTALLLLGPGTPMLFQGQEFGASSPFLFFADHEPKLAALVYKGRRGFLQQFASIRDPAMTERIPEPHDPQTFARCKLDFSERAKHAEIYALHRDLLRLRRNDPVFQAQRPNGVDGAILGEEALVLRFFGDSGADRLLLVNLGRDLALTPVPEPLMAPPQSQQWEMAWSSSDPRYGGCGTAPVETADGWHIPGEAAVVLRTAPAQGAGHG
jgi:maltooligosyltrehalose trehalohydrolase